jgi:hypothetical protein
MPIYPPSIVDSLNQYGSRPARDARGFAPWPVALIMRHPARPARISSLRAYARKLSR